MRDMDVSILKEVSEILPDPEPEEEAEQEANVSNNRSKRRTTK